MKQSIISSFVGVFFVLLLSSPVFAASASLSGRLFDQNHNPVTGGVVVIADGTGKQVKAVMTDASGYYTMTIPSGTYTLSASGQVGKVIQTETLANQHITSQATIDFTLTTPSTKSILPKKPTDTFRALVLGIGIDALLIAGISAAFFFRKKRLTEASSV